MQIRKFINPIRAGGTYYHPIHFSPVFAALCLGLLILAYQHSPLLSIHHDVPISFQWAILSYLALCSSLGAGFIPPFLANLNTRWGYASVHVFVLVVCLVIILARWMNPNVEISPIPAFFEIAGIVGVLMLFSWPAMKFMGTRHDPEEERQHEELMLHNAVAALLRRDEIAMEEASIANPLEIDPTDIALRLQSLPIRTQWSIEREMAIQRLIRKDLVKYGMRYRGQRSL